MLNEREWGLIRLAVNILIISFLCLISSAEIIGGYTADYLDYGVGARYLGMGSVGRTIAKDANAGYWNPALLPQVRDISMTGMTTTLLGVTKYNQLAFSAPLNENDVIACTYLGFNVDQMELHGINADPVSTPEGYFSAQKNAIMVSIGHKMTPSVNVGLTTKYGSRRVYNSQDSVLALDVGSYLDFGDFQWGGTLRNLVSIKLGEQTDDNYDFDFDFGASYRVNNFLFSCDVARILRKNTSFYAGAEYTAISIKDNFDLKIRGGVNSNEISLGLGLQTTPIFFDYAFMIRPLSQEHLFSMGLSLENAPVRGNNCEGERWTKKVFEAIDNNEFSAAKEYARAGVDQDPQNQKLQALDAQLGLILEIIALRLIRDSNNQRLLYESIHNILDGNFEQAVDTAEYLARKNNAIQVFNYKQLIESFTGNVSKYKGVDLVQSVMERSKMESKENRMEASIKSLREVLYYEPKNVEALKQLGDSYVILNESKNAIDVYERAHQLQPENKEISDDLSQLLKKTT